MAEGIDRLFAALVADSEEIAITDARGASSWRELDRRSRRWAHRIRELGLEPGARVLVHAGPSTDLVVALLGHHRARTVHVPVNTRWTAPEIAHVVRDCTPSLLVADVAGLRVLDEVEEARELPRVLLEPEFESAAAPSHVDPGFPEGEDIALLIYTSGTTGPPKGVALPFSSLLANIGALTDEWGFCAEDRLVLALPLFHVHGLCIGIHGSLMQGTRVHMLPRFDADAVLEAMDAGGSVFMGVPTMYALLLEALDAAPERAEPLRRGRLFTAGSAALSPEHFARFAALTGHDILERYGMSETLITLTNPGAGPRRPGFVGGPVPGCEVRLVDEEGRDVVDGELGELWVRSNGIMREYWGKPEATAACFEGEWFKTGDVVVREGTPPAIRIVGRKSVDLIKSGGFKISAREIEEVLAECDGVSEVAVLGLPDEKWGERIVAWVVPKPTAAGLDPAAWLERIREKCGASLASYKMPKEVRLLSELPRNAMGKTQKRRLLDGPHDQG